MSTYFPTAADLANDTLATKPHSTLHGDLGDALSDRITALGLVDLTGYNNHPTLFDPAQAAWDDGSWWSVELNTPDFGIHVGYEDTIFCAFEGSVVAGSPNRHGAASYTRALSDDLAKNAEVTTNAQINADGTNPAANLDITFTGGPTGYFSAFLDGSAVTLFVVAHAGQTDPLLDLQDNSSASILKVTGDNKIGFYNHATTALQTGVAVSAPGIHAALVNLGLITA